MDNLTQLQLEQIATVAAAIGVESYRKELSDARREAFKRKKQKTKDILSSYRRLKRLVEDTKTFTEDEKAEYRWKFIEDLMDAGPVDKFDRIIIDEEKKRQENLYTIYWIENAMTLYRTECEHARDEEERRRYKVIELMYLNEDAMTPDEIAENQHISRSTVFRDINAAIGILTVYLFGLSD